ncbi:hypothetical protein GIR35_12340 [Enterococcus faecalis]|nr:hypothetical protein GIR35_12340 [Enterococcus faecalis]
MAYDAELIKKDTSRDEVMEREENRIGYESDACNLSTETREMRDVGREPRDDAADVRKLIGAVKQLQESVVEQRADIDRAVEMMNRMICEMHDMVKRIEYIYAEAKDDEQAMQQAALNGVNKAQQRAEEITLRNIEEATQRSKKVIDTMALESKRRIERLAMVTLHDRLFRFLSWVVLILILFILIHIIWQMF